MINPDRTELRLQPTLTPENPRNNNHIPRWLKAPVFTARTFLAILTATPGVVAADAIYTTIKPSMVYTDSTLNFNLDSRVKPPGLDSKIDLVRGQQINVKASGRAQYNHGSSECAPPSSPVETDPDGKRYINGSTCPPLIFFSRLILPNVPLGQLIAHIDSGPWFPVGSNYTGWAELNGRLFLLYNDANWDDNIGGYNITVNITDLLPTATALRQTPKPTVTQTPDAPATATELAKAKSLSEEQASIRGTAEAKAVEKLVAKELADKIASATARAEQAKPKETPTLIPVPEIRPNQVIPAGPSTPQTGIPSWLWGLGVVSIAGLVAFWSYEKWNRKNPLSPPPPPAPPPPGSGGPNPNTAPSTAPNMGPAQPKNPEWIIGQKEFARRWQDVKSKLPPVRAGDTGNEQGYILDRFKAGMNVIHETLLEDATNVPEMDTRVRAGIEYLISEIWPDKRIFKRFFDPQFNAGLLTPEDLAKIIYLPEKYLHLSIFTKAQRRDIMTIRRGLLHALHPDLLKKDSDPKLKGSLDILLKQLNTAWPLINKLIS